MTDSGSSVADAPKSLEENRLAPWTTGELPEAPRPGYRLWIGLLGPGIVLAGTSIGSGEWLTGPAVSAQYGATLLWLASISILLQAFCNLMMMRYTLYCGEPILVGGMRTWPGPKSWILFYAILDIASIWPFNAANAAVPLAAAMLGHLPVTDSEKFLVTGLGYAIFILAFVPLIFGGTVYRMLEKVMTFKLVVVLGYLTFIAVFMVSSHNAWDVLRGFVGFGNVPLRAESVVADGHFNFRSPVAEGVLVVRGYLEEGEPKITELALLTDGRKQALKSDTLSAELKAAYDRLLVQARELAQPKRFFMRADVEGTPVTVNGMLDGDRRWQVEQIDVTKSDATQTFRRLADVPEQLKPRLTELIENQGFHVESLPTYIAKNGRLPVLDWATIVAFIGIAGAGGLSNTMFSNYCRDKGWGMGARVGAIPSAIGGRTIELSHTGEVFPVNQTSLIGWRLWIRHVVRDQGIFVICSFIGMALPCMMSLQFIRNATVSSHAVAAMTAQGMANEYPSYAGLFWTMTLLCGFLVLAPGQVSVCDQIARRWTDIIWSSSRWAKQLAGTQVKYIYYGILTLYLVWGLFILAFISNPFRILQIGAVLGNVALGASCLQAWYANRMLLPKELQPSWFLQIGAAVCGLFFIGITILVVATL